MRFKNCTEKELWEYVAEHLSAKGIKTVLVGGAVVAIYSKGAYRSGDLDIVINTFTNVDSEINSAMSKIGFSKKGRHWIHPECEHLFIEFCLPPVSIGDDYNIKPIEVIRNSAKIYLLSPTDCIKDRLGAFMHWKARECLDQAVLVAKANKFDTAHVKDWCMLEHRDGEEFYKEFLGLLDELQMCKIKQLTINKGQKAYQPFPYVKH